MLNPGLNDPAGEADDVLPEYEYHDGQQYPKTAHLCLLPPCQFSLDFYDFGVRPVSVDDDVPVDHLLFGRHGPFLRLVFERMEQRPVRIDSGVRNGKRRFQMTGGISDGLPLALNGNLYEYSIGNALGTHNRLDPHAVARGSRQMPARAAGGHYRQ